MTTPRFPDARALEAASLIARRIGASRVVDDEDLLEKYARDESGADPVLPAAVVRPRSADDVRVVLEVADRLGVPVTPRGGGTGKSGGALPLQGGLVLATGEMSRILSIDNENLLAVVEPGVITGSLHEAVEEAGLFYPPDPASLDSCAIGGNVAENAGGPRAFKYGVTGSYVLGVEAVLPGGAVHRTGRRTVKGVAGYDLTSLLVGSEGTLGVFTEITLRLVARPQGVRTVLVLFSDAVTAGRAVSRVVREGLAPRVIELLDQESIDAIREGHTLPVPAAAGALLLVEVDGEVDALESQVVRIAEACEREGAIDVLPMQTEVDARRLWAARRELSELLGRRLGHKLADDVAVPCGSIPSMIEASRRIAERHGVQSACYGHAGDGNLHVNVLWDDEGLAGAARAAMGEIVTKAVELGGTITGEHGVGSVKRDLLPLEQSPELIALQLRIKELFDPKGILNPGKIFPAPDAARRPGSARRVY